MHDEWKRWEDISYEQWEQQRCVRRPIHLSSTIVTTSLPHRTEAERLEWIEYDKEVENRKKVITFIYFSDVGSVHDWRGGLINALCFFWNEICQTLLMAFRDRCRQRARDKQLNIMRIKYATTQVCSI